MRFGDLSRLARHGCKQEILRKVRFPAAATYSLQTRIFQPKSNVFEIQRAGAGQPHPGHIDTRR